MSRVEIKASAGQGVGWVSDCEAEGFRCDRRPLEGDEDTFEERATHPDGTVIRMFMARRINGEGPPMDLAYIYPPGGTDRPTGPPTLPAFARAVVGPREDPPPSGEVEE